VPNRHDRQPLYLHDCYYSRPRAARLWPVSRISWPERRECGARGLRPPRL